MSSHVRSHVFHTVALGARPSTSSAAVAEPGVASQRLKLTYQELTAGVSVMYGSLLWVSRARGRWKGRAVGGLRYVSVYRQCFA